VIDKPIRAAAPIATTMSLLPSACDVAVPLLDQTIVREFFSKQPASTATALDRPAAPQMESTLLFATARRESSE
jgi:hypothetical protein